MKTLFLSKVFYAIRANFLELLVNVIVTLLIPKFLGNDFEQYGYFQVYLFYVAYVGFFHFGWCDGILLREGGKTYDELNKPLCSSQFRLICIVEISIALIISTLAFLFTINEYRFVYTMVALNVVIYTPRRLLQYYLQSTNRIEEYAKITEIGRGVYGILLVLILFVEIRNYKLIIIGDIIGKIIALLSAVYICRDIVFSKANSLSAGIKEAYQYISVGIKLLFANIAGMLITGIVRWGIQVNWDIDTYGKISFSLSVSNFILSFISAIAVVLYPTLKRKNREKLPLYYNRIRNILMLFLFTCLLLYYPVRTVLGYWLPQYEESIRYMAILFPVCVYAAKTSLLVQTYMNIFRMEKKLMQINIIGVALAAATTGLTVFALKNLMIAIASIVFNQMVRCVYAEIIVSRYMKITVIKDIIIETIVVTLFIVFHWFLGGITGLMLYMICYAFYIAYKRDTMKEIYMLVNKRHKNI